LATGIDEWRYGRLAARSGMPETADRHAFRSTEDYAVAKQNQKLQT